MKMKVKKFSAVLVAFLVAVTSMVLPLSDTFNSVIKTTGSAKAVTKNSAVKMPSDAILFDSSEEKLRRYSHRKRVASITTTVITIEV